MRRLGREDGLRRMTEMENELGHILPILPNDLTILLSFLMSLTLRPLMAFSDTITCHPHVSESTCMYRFLCSTMNAVSAAVHAVLAWRLDPGFLTSCREEQQGRSRSLDCFCMRLLQDTIGPFVPLCEVREDQKCCQYIDLLSSRSSSCGTHLP